MVMLAFLTKGVSGREEINIEALRSGTFEKKIQTIESIVKAENKIYLPELGAVLQNESNEEIRSKAVLALVDIGDSTCNPYFKMALEDTYWQVRLYGIKGLVKYGEGNLIPVFKSAMRDSYWQVRYYAAVGLGKYGDETVVSDLIGYLRDKNEKVNEKVLWSLLVLMRGDEARNTFQKLPENRIKPVLDKTKSLTPEIRIRSLWLLESTDDKRAIPYFIKMLSDENNEIKIRALWAIENFKSEEGGKEIESLLAEESVKIKIEGIKTLVNLEMTEGIAGLTKGLSDSNETVRIYSLWALEKFNAPVTYPAIVESLADPSEEVKEYASRLIEKIDDPLILIVLQRFIDDETFSLDSRLSALTILGKIGDSSVKKFILSKKVDSDSLVRYTVIKSFFDLDRFDTDYLETITYLESNDASPRVRSKASDILNVVMREMRVKMNSLEESERLFAIKRVDALIGAKKLPGLLLNMASSKYPEVREKTLNLIREQPDKILSRSVRDMMKESDVSIKKLAALALGEIEDRGAVPLLAEGLRHFDPEMQLICAWSLSKMGIKKNVFPVAVRYVQSDNPEHQRRAAETLGFLKDRRAVSILLEQMTDSELDVKLTCAWALARMGEDKGMEVLIRLSEESIEPVRTSANRYLLDRSIPLSLRNKIAQTREKMHFEKLGIREVSPKVANASKTKQIIEIDGLDRERFWQTAEKESLFIEVYEENIKSEIQTKVTLAYDESNLYFLFICDDPDTSKISLNSRDFITLSINPLNSFREWYQFVIHPLKHVRYCYIWKFYSDDEPERLWISDWKVETKIEDRRWLVEIVIPLKDLKVEEISQGDRWSINFQRESEHIPVTSWSGRIDNPEQFGILYFKE